MSQDSWIGIDFGTSNSSAAYLRDGNVVHVEFEPSQSTMPTSIFFTPDQPYPIYGGEANTALLNGDDGRYMRALKSVLGTQLMGEERFITQNRLDFYQIITSFLIQLKERAEAQAGHPFDNVVAGRPVFFHSDDKIKDAKAESDLRQCFHAAGFQEVRFLFEPEAAALACAETIRDQTLGLVVDIGGGTSDFTVFRRDANQINILASNGIRVGGTDFDRVLNYQHFMPLLGCGERLSKPFSDKLLEAPTFIYSDLSTWEKIPFLYDQKTIQLAKNMQRDAVHPTIFGRLVEVLEMRLGHDLAFRAEDLKISLNQVLGSYEADLGFIEAQLKAEISYEEFNSDLASFCDQLTNAIGDTIRTAQIEPEEIQTVVAVGGSSTMTIVNDAIDANIHGAKIQKGKAFTAIVDGLAIATGKAN